MRREKHTPKKRDKLVKRFVICYDEFGCTHGGSSSFIHMWLLIIQSWPISLAQFALALNKFAIVNCTKPAGMMTSAREKKRTKSIMNYSRNRERVGIFIMMLATECRQWILECGFEILSAGFSAIFHEPVRQRNSCHLFILCPVFICNVKNISGKKRSFRFRCGVRCRRKYGKFQHKLFMTYVGSRCVVAAFISGARSLRCFVRLILTIGRNISKPIFFSSCRVFVILNISFFLLLHSVQSCFDVHWGAWYLLFSVAWRCLGFFPKYNLFMLRVPFRSKS